MATAAAALTPTSSRFPLHDAGRSRRQMTWSGCGDGVGPTTSGVCALWVSRLRPGHGVTPWSHCIAVGPTGHRRGRGVGASRHGHQGLLEHQTKAGCLAALPLPSTASSASSNASINASNVRGSDSSARTARGARAAKQTLAFSSSSSSTSSAIRGLEAPGHDIRGGACVEGWDFGTPRENDEVARAGMLRVCGALGATVVSGTPRAKDEAARAVALRVCGALGAAVVVVLMAMSMPEAAVATSSAAVAALADAAAAVAGQQPVLSFQDACVEELGELGTTNVNTIIVAACIAEFIALTGAAVGGYLARQRKEEVEKINAQLRQINVNLRKQARVESYAPSLSYAPVGSPAAAAASKAAATSPATSAVVLLPTAAPPGAADAQVPGDSRKEEVVRMLKQGKKHLRSGENAWACDDFQRALALAQEMGDVVEEKKAARGVGASLQRQRKFQEAIKYHKLVLERCTATAQHGGSVEAYGAIADCYTELGDLEMAAKYYDMYISHMEEDD